jgi:HD-GYP domain-containing protein (c-di-GMP phosphodiesterase class II)
LAARIFAVADALDAMTSDRPYRRAMGWSEAAEELVRESGRQFDPQVVTAFVDSEDRLRGAFGDVGAGQARSSSR